MPRRIERSDEEIMAALQGCGGIVGFAARLLGMSPRTLSRRIAASPDLANTLFDEEQGILDAAQDRVIRAIRSGDVAASKWWLLRFGADKGFALRYARTKVADPHEAELLRRQALHIMQAFAPWFEETPEDQRGFASGAL